MAEPCTDRFKPGDRATYNALTGRKFQCEVIRLGPNRITIRVDGDKHVRVVTCEALSRPLPSEQQTTNAD